jgi:hypothetical protein
MTVEDLGHEATELLSLSNGEAKSLSKLAEMAVRQVPGCAAAHATIWRGGELAAVSASHPDPAELVDLETRIGLGPLTTAVSEGKPVSCADTLYDERWPRWAEEALRRGLRSSVHLVRQFPPMTLVLALFGARPGSLDADGVPMAEMLARFGSTVFANSLAYGEAQRTATQLKDSVAARAVTDQAKGILMHALGCDADEALRYLRRESQRRHVKVTEVAARVIATYAPGGRGPQGLSSAECRRTRAQWHTNAVRCALGVWTERERRPRQIGRLPGQDRTGGGAERNAACLPPCTKRCRWRWRMSAQCCASGRSVVSPRDRQLRPPVFAKLRG